MAANNRGKRNRNKPMIFSAWNYKILAIGFFLVIAGFTAMYLENKVEGIISLYISPIVIMAGYITVIVAILKHDQNSSAASGQS